MDMGESLARFSRFTGDKSQHILGDVCAQACPARLVAAVGFPVPSAVRIRSSAPDCVCSCCVSRAGLGEQSGSLSDSLCLAVTVRRGQERGLVLLAPLSLTGLCFGGAVLLLQTQASHTRGLRMPHGLLVRQRSSRLGVSVPGCLALPQNCIPGVQGPSAARVPASALPEPARGLDQATCSLGCFLPCQNQAASAPLQGSGSPG